MKKKTIIELNKYITSCKDYEGLNASKMASECNVSTATISRYAKEKGYENFNHLRYSLIEKNIIRNNLKKSSNVIENKINYINYCLAKFKDFDFEILSILNTKITMVYFETQYELEAKRFVEKMNIIHKNFVMVRTLSELEYIDNYTKGNWSFLCIGNIPKMMYKEQQNYIEITTNNEKNSKLNNVYQIEVLNQKQGKKANKITSNPLPIQIILELISEEYTKKVLSKKELEEVTKFLL